MKFFFIVLSLVFFFGTASFAQTDQSAPCPTITVIGQGGIPDPDQPVIFTAEIGKEAEKFNTILKWNVNNSEKIEGQGTKQIKVLWKDMCNTNLTATIEVFGLPKDCQSTASETAAITCCRFQPLIVDEFSVPATRTDKIKLDNLILYLKISRTRKFI